MRKRLILLFAVFSIALTGGLKAQNLLSHWGADNAGLNAVGVANTEMWRWGWNSNFASYQWATANSASVTIRYCDAPTFHGVLLKGDDVYTGRFAQLRWDGTGNDNAYFTLGVGDGTAVSRGIPKALQLKKDKSYNLSFWVSSLEVVRVKMQVTTDPTGVDESKAISTLDINVQSATNAMTSWNHDLVCPTTGDYYLVFKFTSGKIKLVYLTDIDFHQVTVPTAKAVTGITKNAFTANWSSVSDASNYLLDVATDTQFTSFVAGYNNLSVSGLAQEVSGLSEGTTYYYRVRAVNDGVTSDNSEVGATTTVAANAPSVPSANSATNVQPTSFTAAWSAVPGAVSYQLDVATDAAFTQIVRGYNNYTVVGTSYNVIKLRPNTTYYYRIRAFNGTVSSSSNTTSLKTQKLLMVVMAGQSNMSGRGTYSQLSPTDTVTYSNVLTLNKDLDWVRARHPLHSERSTENGVSVGISFAKKLADMIGGDDVAIGLVPCAAGGTTINQWLTDYYYVRTDSFNLYSNLMTRVTKAKEAGDIIGLIWHQGEGDAVSLGTADSYLNNTKTFFTRLRKDVQIPNMPIVAGEIGHFTSYTYRDVINESMFKLKDFLPYYDVTKSDGLAANSDNVHFSASALVEFGKRYADIFYPVYEAYLNNNDPLLSSLSFDVSGKLNPEFDAEISKYTYYLPEGTARVTPSVTYIGTDVLGVETVNLISGVGVSNFKVTSKDGTFKIYTVNYKINEEKDYTHLIVNNDFDYAPTANCSDFVNVASGVNGWSSNAWRPTASGCGEFYGWKFDMAYTSLGGNSQGINANTGGTKNGEWAASVAGTGAFSNEKHEFSQTIDKECII